MPDITITDSLRAAQVRGGLPTSLDTAGLRELGADILARSAFCARGTNAIFVSKLKEVVDRLAAGDIGEGQARTALYETLDALGYDVEKGGFPGEEVPPALRGTLQDLRSFRRMDLIVRTQLELMTGAGLQARGHTPDRLLEYPAWELVRVERKTATRHWGGVEMGGEKDAETEPRWTIAGGRLAAGKMVAYKGDPMWGELGSYDNFSDALGVDHPPFAFNSGMGWREVSAAEAELLGVKGPNFESADEWFAKNPATMVGNLPLPTPRLSLADVDPEIVQRFMDATSATPIPGRPGMVDFSDILEKELAQSRAAYLAKHPDYDPNYQGGGQ